jgi:hypothetical protein
MAIAGFKSAFFDSAQDLSKFVQASVTTVYSIVYNQDGKYVLFYA